MSPSSTCEKVHVYMFDHKFNTSNALITVMPRKGGWGGGSATLGILMKGISTPHDSDMA